MIKLKSGDIVCCRIMSCQIVSPYRNYDEIKTFTIIACDEQGYYLYIPYYEYLKNTLIVDNNYCKKLGIDKKFIGENFLYIQENMIASIEQKMDGYFCKVCHEFSAYASPNQEDNSFLCFSCAQNPYRR